MIKNHIKISWRNLLKNKGYSAINIFGLALGITSSLLIGIWISSEMDFDRFYSKSERIQQVYTRDVFEGKPHTWGGTAAVLGPVLKATQPEIEEVVRVGDIEHSLTFGEQRIKAAGLASDPAFFKIFDFKFIKGDASTPLTAINAIVLTQSMAKKLFGSTEAVGQTIKVDTLTTMEVKAVIADIPSNSRFYGKEFFCSWNILKLAGWGDSMSWTSYNHETYTLLKEHSSLSTVNKNIKDFVRTQTNNSVKAQIYLYPASRWHLYNKSVNGEMVEGNLVTIRMFALIGFFILLIACINFINLSTAGAERRAKEVGVRKVVGAPKQALITQFIIESFMLTVIAGFLAIIFTTLSLPLFNSIVGTEIQLFSQPFVFWSLFLGIIIFTTLGAGIYPAFILSSFDPIRTLKGNFRPMSELFKPRKILVTFQFTLSICLGICTFIIVQQIHYGQDRDKGYNENNLIYTQLDTDLRKNYNLVRNELLEQNIASSVTKTLGRITHYASNSWGYSWPGAKPEDFDVVFNVMSTDADFSKTMGIKIVKGRDIDSYKFKSDSNAVLLNETAVKRMGLSEPIGAIISAGKGSEFEENLHVVGVIQDFIWKSPYADIEPMLVKGPISWFGYMHIRLDPNKNVLTSIEQIQTILKKYNPQDAVTIHFADQAYASKFVQQKRIATLTAIFASLAILIASLGLLGLVAFAAMQRQKEIGIRKVLGASITGIVALLSKDFLKLVIIAILIASPIAWWVMSNWLDGFVHRVTIQYWTFALAGGIAICIALLTVSGLAIKAASANPIKSLKDE